MAAPETRVIAADPVRRHPRWRRTAIEYSAVCLITLVCLVFVLRLWEADFRVPIHYATAGDVLSQSAIVKGLVEDGWVLSNPRLGAPFGLRWEDYPLSDNLHFLIMKALSFVVPNWAVVLNVFFILGFPLIAATCLFALRELGIRSGPAIVTSVLYAFLPYHFMRGQAHLLLGSYYLVPLTCLLLLWIANGTTLFKRQATGSWAARLGVGGRKSVFSVVVCILTGAAGVYYAFFACVLLLVAGGIASVQARSWRKLAAPAALVLLIMASGVANLSPSIAYAARHGVNSSAVVRSADGVEVYSLKIAQLVLPVTGHRVPMLRRIKNQYSTILGPYANENDTATLGAFGTFGFCALLSWVLVGRRQPNGPLEYALAASQLNLVATLFATTSSFGALASIAIFRQIRAYNRISVYIAFLSLFALAAILQHLRERLARFAWGRGLYAVGIPVVLLVGIADQTTAFFVPPYIVSSAQFRDEETFVRRIEATLPPNSMVFQLPYVPFPENPPVNRMTDYDHLRPYFHSTTLRWSYGAIKGREGDLWVKSISSQPADTLPEKLAAAGYAAIWVDRFGYADNAAVLERTLTSATGQMPITDESGRFALYNISPVAAALRSNSLPGPSVGRQESVLQPVLLDWARGCSGLEGTANDNWRWCGPTAEIVVRNLRPESRQIELAMSLSTGQEKPARVRIHGATFDFTTTASSAGVNNSPQITVPPGTSFIRFDCDGQPLNVPGDPRSLVFRVNNFSAREFDK